MVSEAFAAPGIVDRASFASAWTRGGAYLIDLVIVTAPLWLLQLITTGSPSFPVGTVDQWRASGLRATLWLLPEALYFIGLWTSRWHATIGMRLLGVRVRAWPGDAGLDRSAAVRRWLAFTGPSLLSPLALIIPTPEPTLAVIALSSIWAPILLLTIVGSPTKQGLHDRFAGSIVVPASGSERVTLGAAIVAIYLLVYFSPLATGLRR